MDTQTQPKEQDVRSPINQEPGKSAESQNSVHPKEADALPSLSEIKEANKVPIFAAEGKKQLFGDLFGNPVSSPQKRVLVIFIRHFFCGNCQEYLKSLKSSISSQSSLPEGTSVVVIGCGAASLIPMYVEATQWPFPMYTDPTGHLQSIFGLTRTFDTGPASPEYIKHSSMFILARSVAQGLKRIWSGDSLKSGDKSQNGGEFFFDLKAGQEEENSGVASVTWCHRMQNTRDHSEVSVILKLLGVKSTGD